MNTYDFTLNFALASNQQDPADWVEPLYGGGCSDALLGIGRLGQLSLMFEREAKSAQQAVISAVADVLAIVPDATLHSAEPDLVGLSDVANLLGFSRQYMRKLMEQNPDFPLPFHQGNPSLWHLADPLNWLKTGGKAEIPEASLQVADVTRQLNILIQEGSVEEGFREQAKMQL